MNFIGDQLLFGNRLSPITSSIGFLRVSAPVLAAKILNHFASMEGRAWNPRSAEVVDGLEAVLRRLAPLRRSSARLAVVPTKSDWTALFQGSLSGTDEALPDVMSDQLNCDRLMITYDPGKDEVEFGGSSMPGRVFSYSERPAPLGETTRVRNIWAIVEDGWEFGQIGAPLPGESMNSYGAQRVRDRLPFEHVRALCRLVGTRPFDEDFYDVPRHAATIISLDIPPRSNDPELSIDEAQRWNAR